MAPLAKRQLGSPEGGMAWTIILVMKRISLSAVLLGLLAVLASGQAVHSVEINKRPLKDLANMVNSEVDQQRVSLIRNFSITLNVVIRNDGTFDTDRSKFDVKKQSGEPQILNVAKLAIQACGRTGFFGYLKNLGIDTATITLSQDDSQVTARLVGPVATAERAKMLASSFESIISMGKLTTMNPSDERTLLNAVTTTTDGKTVILNLTVPKKTVQDMITKALQREKAHHQLSPQ
jgi:hypothetical protein